MCDGLSVTVNDTAAALQVANTLADLRAITSSANNRIAYLLGVNAKYDNGPAIEYYWDAASTAADAPLSVVRPNDKTAAQSGRWVQVGP